MSLTDTYFRHQCILRKLQKGPASLSQIREYYEVECEIHGYNVFFSNRTFIRDKQEILSLYKKEIAYNPSSRKYYLEEEEIPDDFGIRIADAYNAYLALNMAEGIAAFVHIEKRRPQGMQHFQDLLFAIRNKVTVHFHYEKYYGQHFSERKVEALALKEFESRWYLLAKDKKDNVIKTFALDRISNLEITKQKFKGETTLNVNEYFQHCFGITRPPDDNAHPEKILLSFKGDKGKYIKSLPLHESQKIIKEDDVELLVEVKLYVTHDFIMELLSHGEELEVIQPQSLRSRMGDILIATLKHYQS